MTDWKVVEKSEGVILTLKVRYSLFAPMPVVTRVPTLHTQRFNANATVNQPGTRKANYSSVQP